MKRKIILFIIFLTLSILIIFNLLPNKKNNKGMILSDYLWLDYFSDEKESILNSHFKTNEFYFDYIYPTLTSQKLLQYLDNDTTKISSSSLSLIDQISKSDYLILNIGLQDFIDYIKIDTTINKLVYDKDILSLKADIFINNFYFIIDQIKEINKNINIYNTSLYYPYPYFEDNDLKNFFDLINIDMKNIIENEKGVFIDISSYSQEKFLNKIDDYKLNTIALNNLYNFIINLDS